MIQHTIALGDCICEIHYPHSEHLYLDRPTKVRFIRTVARHSKIEPKPTEESTYVVWIDVHNIVGNARTMEVRPLYGQTWNRDTAQIRASAFLRTFFPRKYGTDPTENIFDQSMVSQLAVKLSQV